MTTLETIPDRVLDVLLHATGATECARKADLKVGWRNRYNCGPGHDGWDACVHAVMLDVFAPSPSPDNFYATAHGLDLANKWLRRRLRARVWSVTVLDGEKRYTNTYIADTRAKAKAKQIGDLRDAWGCTWLEAAQSIVSVRRSA